MRVDFLTVTTTVIAEALNEFPLQISKWHVHGPLETRWQQRTVKIGTDGVVGGAERTKKEAKAEAAEVPNGKMITSALGQLAQRRNHPHHGCGLADSSVMSTSASQLVVG